MLGHAQEPLSVPWDSPALPMMERRGSHSSEEGHDVRFDSLTKGQAYCLFISHTLSMWNSRMYEFGVVRVLRVISKAVKPSAVG